MNGRHLSVMIKDLIARKGEGVYWDFKLTHHANKGDLVHDVLCLANAEHAGQRFLIFGVDPVDFSLHDIKCSDGAQDPGRYRRLVSRQRGEVLPVEVSGLSPARDHD